MVEKDAIRGVKPVRLSEIGSYGELELLRHSIWRDWVERCILSLWGRGVVSKKL